jgi:hypothetical protein
MSDKHHCGYCGEAFNTQWLLGSHIMHGHGTDWPMSQADKDAVESAKEKAAGKDSE